MVSAWRRTTPYEQIFHKASPIRRRQLKTLRSGSRINLPTTVMMAARPHCHTGHIKRLYCDKRFVTVLQYDTP